MLQDSRFKKRTESKKIKLAVVIERINDIVLFATSRAMTPPRAIKREYRM